MIITRPTPIDAFRFTVFSEVIDKLDLDSVEAKTILEKIRACREEIPTIKVLTSYIHWYQLIAKLICSRDNDTGYRKDICGIAIQEFEITGRVLFNLLYKQVGITPYKIKEVFKYNSKVVLELSNINAFLRTNYFLAGYDLDVDIEFGVTGHAYVSLLKKRNRLDFDIYYPQYDGYLIRMSKANPHWLDSPSDKFQMLIKNYQTVLQRLGYRMFNVASSKEY